MLDFLKVAVAEAPELPPLPEEPPARLARQRYRLFRTTAEIIMRREWMRRSLQLAPLPEKKWVAACIARKRCRTLKK